MKTALVALGGNAILRAGERDEYAVQLKNTRAASAVIADLVRAHYHLVVTHGNGPQVGNLLLQNELAAGGVPPSPLDALVAESQGLIGYMLLQGLDEEFRRKRLGMQSICVLTRTLVHANDPAFRSPSKPVGSYYTREESLKLRREKHWRMMLDTARGGYRRIVPSPEPYAVVEGSLLKSFFHSKENRKELLIISGGGGVPVVRRGRGFRGVEAVIDKDLAAQVVATSLGLDHLFILTDVDAVYLDFGTDRQRPLRRATAEEMRRHMEDGQFGKGSMLPKVEAAVKFVEAGGRSAIITSQEEIFSAISGRQGTTVSGSD